MRKFCFLSVILGIFLAISACGTKSKNEVNSEVNSTTAIVEVPREPTGTTLLGMGVEFDPHFFSQNLTRQDGARPEDWEIVRRRVSAMKVQRFRVMLQPQWYEPVNDNDDPHSADFSRFTFDNVEMQSVFKVLDLAMETGADVTLVLWGCPIWCDFVDASTPGHAQAYWLYDSNCPNWVSNPTDNEEFAENFSSVAKYLIEEKGYTCIKELTPFNEPDGNVCELDRYIEICKLLDAHLRKDGIRDRISLNLSDNTDCRRWFLEGSAKELSAVADVFNSHTYIFGYDTPNDTVMRWERMNIEAVRGNGGGQVPHFVGEFGSNQCVGASRQTDINLYERGVLMVRHCINFLNAGAAGASYWGLIDQYYGRNADYSQMQQLGLWRYVKAAYAPEDMSEDFTEDYRPRPQYYAYSLLTRSIRKGSKVYPLDLKSDFAAGTSVLGPDGKWCFAFANGSGDPIAITLDPSGCQGGAPSRLALSRYAKDELPEDDSMIGPVQTLKRKNGKFFFELPANSVVVLNQVK